MRSRYSAAKISAICANPDDGPRCLGDMMVLLSSDIELLNIATNPTPEGRRPAETPMSKLQFDPEAPSLADRLAPEASITSVKTAQLGAAGRGRSGGSAPKKKYVRFACDACYLHDVLGYAFQTDVETPTEPVAVGSALSRGTRMRLNEEAAVDVGERLGKAWYAHCCNALAKTVKRWDIVGCSGKERNTVRQSSCGAASTGGGEAANEAEPYTADYMVHECLLKEGLVDGRVLFSEDANNLEYRTFAYEYWEKEGVKLLVPAWQINVEAMKKAEGPFNAKQAIAGATSLNLRLMANPTAPGTLISRQGQCLEPLPPPWHNKYINWLAILKHANPPFNTLYRVLNGGLACFRGGYGMVFRGGTPMFCDLLRSHSQTAPHHRKTHTNRLTPSP